jgi:hypothetical protein
MQTKPQLCAILENDAGEIITEFEAETVLRVERAEEK